MRFPLYLCLLFPVAVMSAVPALLTDEERAAHERMAEPVRVPERMHDPTREEDAARELLLKPIASLEGLDRATLELNEQMAHDDEKLNSVMKEFLTTAGLPAEQLITAPVSESASTEAGTPGGENTSAPKDDSQLMVVNSEDGMYFDSEEGLLVYLRDVRVKDPRFNLRCDNQLKIYLERDNKKSAEPDKKKDENEKTQGLKTPDTSALNFSGVKSIAASGNVVITRQGKDGKMMEARADKATYDGKTGEVILSGDGRKSVQDGENLVETNGAGSYIRMYGNGDVRIVGKRTVTKVKTSDEKGNPLKDKKK